MALAWTLLARPDGMPRIEDFALKFIGLPPVADGMVHVRNRFLSVDPYMRGRMNDAISTPRWAPRRTTPASPCAA